MLPKFINTQIFKHSTYIPHSYHNIRPDLQRFVNEAIREQQTEVTLEKMFSYGQNPSKTQLLENAQFLWKEIPIRVAHRIHDLKCMPYGLSNQPSVIEVRNIYLKTFEDLKSVNKPETESDELKFTEILDQILENHKFVLEMMARGLQSLRKEFLSINVQECPYLVRFLNRFYGARIALRILAGQHVAMHTHAQGFVGLIEESCSPAEVLRNSVYKASSKCRLSYGDSPEVEIMDISKIRLRYMPSQLDYIFTELLKNSMRATVELHIDDPPPIKAVIVDGKSEITVKISDRGGGIPRSKLDKIWSYSFTTSRSSLDNPSQSMSSKEPMSGYGYGMPISRLHARAFGGDLQVLSMDGHGTDAYVYLSKLGTAKGPFEK